MLVAVPVGGAPSLQVGSSATYNVSVAISFSSPYCGTTTTSSSLNNILYCADLASVEVNGTLRWTSTGLNATSAVLNVTRDLSTFFASNLTTPVFKNAGSFNESIKLANRTISVLPFIMPELDQALQSLPATSSWASSMRTMSSAMWVRHPVYTMWWVNGPLKVNDTVPVLVFSTNVTRSTSLTLSNIGTRTAWVLAYNLTIPSPLQDPTIASTVLTGDNLLASFSFNYDQQSDLLLSASANMHFGFIEPLVYPPNPCVSSGTTVCPASSSSLTVFESGVNIQATLTLSSTNLNLDQRLSSTGGSSSGSGSDGITGGSSSSGTAGGSGSGGTSGGSGSGRTNGGSGSTGTDGGAGSGSNGGTNPISTPQSTATKPASGIPWIYWILGIVAVAIIVSGTFFARRRAARNQSQVPHTQSP